MSDIGIKIFSGDYSNDDGITEFSDMLHQNILWMVMDLPLVLI